MDRLCGVEGSTSFEVSKTARSPELLERLGGCLCRNKRVLEKNRTTGKDITDLRHEHH